MAYQPPSATKTLNEWSLLRYTVKSTPDLENLLWKERKGEAIMGVGREKQRR